MAFKYFAISVMSMSFAIYGAVRLQTLNSELATSAMHHTQLVSSQIPDINIVWPDSVAADFFTSGLEYQVFEDIATKTVAASSLHTQDNAELLMQYLRNNFVQFTKLPQAYILWLVADRKGKQSFDKSHIEQLHFEPGDLLAGTYTVVRRDLGAAELLMSLGEKEAKSYVEGRLIVSISIDSTADLVTFKTQTLMWRRMDAGILMPMERTVPRWMHKVTNLWLIDQGISYLQTPETQRP